MECLPWKQDKGLTLPRRQADNEHPRMGKSLLIKRISIYSRCFSISTLSKGINSMKWMVPILTSLALVFLLCSMRGVSVQADTIKLKNGAIIEGKFISETEDMTVIKMENMEINIPTQDIEKITPSKYEPFEKEQAVRDLLDAPFTDRQSLNIPDGISALPRDFPRDASPLMPITGFFPGSVAPTDERYIRIAGIYYSGKAIAHKVSGNPHDNDLLLFAKPGAEYTLGVVVDYRIGETAKLAANLSPAGELMRGSSDFGQKVSLYNSTVHFDTKTRAGYQDVQGKGPIQFTLTSWAPDVPGVYREGIEVGLYDPDTFGNLLGHTHSVRFRLVVQGE
jgi:hypothetical protein